jgi:hypothetical protein
MLRALLALLGRATGEDRVTEAGTAGDLDASEGLRFLLIVVRTGCGTSSSCDAFRFRNDRVPSGGSSGRMSSLKMECPPGSTPRCDGSRSLASLGTDDNLRRVSDWGDSSCSSLLSSCRLFCMQAVHRQCFTSRSSQQTSYWTWTGKAAVPSSGLSVLASRAHCRCAAGTKEVSYPRSSMSNIAAGPHTIVPTHDACEIFLKIWAWVILFVLIAVAGVMSIFADFSSGPRV